MNRLRELREEKGLTQKEFGTLVKASQNTVSQWENGKRNIEVDRLLQFANFFNCTTDDILGTSDLKQQKTIERNNLSEIEKNILNGLSKLPQEFKAEVLDYIAFKLSQAGEQDEISKDK